MHYLFQIQPVPFPSFYTCMPNQGGQRWSCWSFVKPVQVSMPANSPWPLFGLALFGLPVSTYKWISLALNFMQPLNSRTSPPTTCSGKLDDGIQTILTVVHTFPSYRPHLSDQHRRYHFSYDHLELMHRTARRWSGNATPPVFVLSPIEAAPAGQTTQNGYPSWPCSALPPSPSPVLRYLQASQACDPVFPG